MAAGSKTETSPADASPGLLHAWGFVHPAIQSELATPSVPGPSDHGGELAADGTPRADAPPGGAAVDYAPVAGEAVGLTVLAGGHGEERVGLTVQDRLVGV